MSEEFSKQLKKVRRRHLTERLETLRTRTQVIEQELSKYTNDFFRVCIFGSARIKPHDEIYQQTEQLAFLLGQAGIDVLTGGGPGLMEAANKGAKAGRLSSGSKSKSFGISIELDFEKVPNEHLDIKHHHRRFSSRLDDFMRLSNAIIVTPGGIGTLLELYFCWQLLQVKHLSERPIVLLDKKFWEGLISWMDEQQVGKKLVSPPDLRFAKLVDSPEEVMAIITPEYEKFRTSLAAATAGDSNA